jgi:hypothetical protein
MDGMAFTQMWAGAGTGVRVEAARWHLRSNHYTALWKTLFWLDLIY